MLQGLKVAFVTNIPTPYRSVMSHAWVEETGINLTVYYTEPGDMGRGWAVPAPEGIKEVRLPVVASFGQYGRLNHGLSSVVRAHDAIIIGGYEQPTYLWLMALCRKLRKPYVLLFDGISPKKIDVSEGGKVALKRWAVAGARACFANGLVGKRYMEKLGMRAEGIFNQYLSVDGCRIGKAIEDTDIRSLHRAELDIADDQRVILYVGRFIPQKNVTDIIRAISLLETEKYVFIGVGSGPTLEYVRRLGTELGVRAIFPGFASQDDLPKWYAVGDVLILPSSNEAWGLVCNEAMAAGLPIIVSDEVGCGPDLVIEGETGFAFEVGDTDGLAACIGSATSACSNMGTSARELISRWTPVESARSLKECLAKIICNYSL